MEEVWIVAHVFSSIRCPFRYTGDGFSCPHEKYRSRIAFNKHVACTLENCPSSTICSEVEENNGEENDL